MKIEHNNKTQTFRDIALGDVFMLRDSIYLVYFLKISYSTLDPDNGTVVNLSTNSLDYVALDQHVVKLDAKLVIDQ